MRLSLGQMIPRRLIRTVPEQGDGEQERLWKIARDLHPRWQHVTLRDPIDPAAFPLTSGLWHRCLTGAQLADLVRIEELYHRGGVYIDSDVECYRPFDVLRAVDAFAAWEDRDHIPNAVLGAKPGHPAIGELVKRAVEMMPCDTWDIGVGLTTEVLSARDDVLLLPPGSFYPYHYRQKWRTGTPPRAELVKNNPWAWCAHHWAASWKP